jgi:glycosyltransferase involved in cell wall biosynthesis
MVQGILESIIKRIAFTLIGDGFGTGIYNYLLNLVRAIDLYASDLMTPVLFVGENANENDVAPFREIRAAEIVQSASFNFNHRNRRLRDALIRGVDRLAASCYKERAIDVAFESAAFYGRNFPIPVLAWLPDFQHRHMPKLFGIKAYWKRELGFRAQHAARRLVMVSSEDARDDCERFYPSSRGRICVVQFAVPADTEPFRGNLWNVVREHGLPENFFYLPNQFWRHKNHGVVMDALLALKQRGHEFVVAASGKQKDPRHPRYFELLRSRVTSLGLEANFRFLGLIPRPHVAALMRTCTALINPSLFEGWSTTVEEAKSRGVPMLLSNLRVHREQAGDSAHFFEPESVSQLSGLMAAQPRMSEVERTGLEQAASDDAARRVRRFCLDFQKTVECAAASFERPRARRI